MLSSLAIDILVMPEMAFAGYHFADADAVAPHAERVEEGRRVGGAGNAGGADDAGDAESSAGGGVNCGPAATWCARWAAALRCVVVAGFARRGEEHAGAPRFYNSQLAVSPEGLVLAVYDKHFLYVTDKTWATPGKSFRALELPGLGIKVGLGVCMDINPREFEAPYDAYELANYHKEAGVDLILFSSAWCNRHPDDPPEAAEAPNAAETIAYWVHRLVPLVGGERRVYLVCSDRVGEEEGTQFCGSSCVLSLQEPAIVGALDAERSDVLVCDCVL